MSHGYVYFLSGGMCVYKIGRTTRKPTARIAEYSPLLPFDTELVHVIECENCEQAEEHAHSVFESSHMRGEWYRICDEDIVELKAGIMDYIADIDYVEDEPL